MALDNNKVVRLLSTDVSKAFDSLYHPFSMLTKLRAYGFSGNNLNIIVLNPVTIKETHTI